MVRMAPLFIGVALLIGALPARAQTLTPLHTWPGRDGDEPDKLYRDALTEVAMQKHSGRRGALPPSAEEGRRALCGWRGRR
jgi:hypothetical protein